MKRAFRLVALVCAFAACTQEDAVIRVQDADALYLDVLTASSSMTLSTASATPGTVVTARVTFKNTSSRALTLPRIEVASSGAAFGPAKTNVSLAAYASVSLTATRTISGSDPAGIWDVYPRVTGMDGVVRKYAGRKLTVSGTTSTGSAQIIGARVVVSRTLAVSLSGSTLSGTITYTNTGDSPATLQNLQVTARRPGATNSSGPYDTLSPMYGTFSLAAGASITINATRAMTSTDPDGQWYAYSTYQDAGGWHDCAPVYFTKSTTVSSTPNPSSKWLATRGNKIYSADGAVWQGRGVNMADTRGCGACVGSTPSADETIRRINEAVDNWNVDFIRLDLESYAGTAVNSRPVTSDAAYLADVVKIVKHIGTKPGVYVLLSLWVDPTFSAAGWPTTQTQDTWKKLAQTFKDDAHVMFGLVNEPQNNFDGAQDAAVWSAMNATVAAIRSVETQQHIITVQGTGAWGRRLGYYVTHPITSGGGTNIAYETHVYDPTAQFDTLFVQPSKTLPVIIGEFGPLNMTLTDTANLMKKADELEIPYLAWTFHMRCPPNLLVDNSNHSCGVNMPLQPTEWGQQLKTHLQR